MLGLKSAKIRQKKRHTTHFLNQGNSKYHIKISHVQDLKVYPVSSGSVSTPAPPPQWAALPAGKGDLKVPLPFPPPWWDCFDLLTDLHLHLLALMLIQQADGLLSLLTQVLLLLWC